MKRVLVCVLDWGLGHATRSIPVIKELQRQGAEVLLAASGSAGSLLKQEFPLLSYHELPAYRPRYPRSGSMTLSMVAQLPGFHQAIRQEHVEVEALVKNLRIDAVISDNRYGCYAGHVPSILITHQPRIRLSSGFGLTERLVNAWLRRLLGRFREIWVPDQPGSGLTDNFLAARMPIRLVGWLSRFPLPAKPVKSFPIMAIVSGPEPQRTLFAQQLHDQLRHWPGRALLVTGEPEKNRMEHDGDLEIVSHLAAEPMESELRGAEFVVARSGYSTIMDLIALGKRAAFVPTPRQPEQIYLANTLREAGIAYCQDQKNFVLKDLVQHSSTYPGLGIWKKEQGWLEPAIKDLLS